MLSMPILCKKPAPLTKFCIIKQVQFDACMGLVQLNPSFVSTQLDYIGISKVCLSDIEATVICLHCFSWQKVGHFVIGRFELLDVL